MGLNTDYPRELSTILIKHENHENLCENTVLRHSVI